MVAPGVPDSILDLWNGHFSTRYSILAPQCRFGGGQLSSDKGYGIGTATAAAAYAKVVTSSRLWHLSKCSIRAAAASIEITNYMDLIFCPLTEGSFGVARWHAHPGVTGGGRYVGGRVQERAHERSTLTQPRTLYRKRVFAMQQHKHTSPPHTPIQSPRWLEIF